MCDDVPPSSECEVHLRRTFLEPGTYCVNITLEDSSSLALTTTTVTINKSQDTHGQLHKDMYSHILHMFTNLYKSILFSFVVSGQIDWLFCLSGCVPVVSKTSNAAVVVLSSTAVLVAVFAFVAYLVCKWVAMTCRGTYLYLKTCVLLFWPPPKYFHPLTRYLTFSRLPGVTRCIVPSVGHWWRTPAAQLGSEVAWFVWRRHYSPPVRRAITCWLRDAPCRL